LKAGGLTADCVGILGTEPGGLGIEEVGAAGVVGFKVGGLNVG
jgi:hypothetical protein